MASLWRNRGAAYDQGDSVDIDEALAILREGKTKTVNGKPDYKIIRLIRALCLLMNKPMKDTKKTWRSLRCMSKSVKQKVKACGIYAYATALKFRDAMRRRLDDDSYNLDNLICFVCLAF